MKLSSQLLILSGAQAYTHSGNWEESFDVCEASGGNLSIPTTHEEVVAICDLAPNTHVWLGIYKDNDSIDSLTNIYDRTTPVDFHPFYVNFVPKPQWKCMGIICYEGVGNQYTFSDHDCMIQSVNMVHLCDVTTSITVTTPTTASPSAATINVGTGGRTWQEAVDVCAAEGKTLPIPRSEAEVNELCTLSPNTHVWTGVIKGDDPDTYISYVDSSPAPYLEFVGNCPTCNCSYCTSPNPLTPSEKCMALICYVGSQNTYTFMDHPCETKGSNYISFCHEAEVPVTVTTPTAPPSATTGLSCFHCDAPNFAECQRTGEMKQCLSNEETCQIEQRKRNGVVKQIHTGCKQELACQNNKKQNFTGKHKNWQCRPWKWNKKGPSVCRQCCNGSDSCATDFLSDAGWNSPSLTTDGWAKNM